MSTRAVSRRSDATPASQLQRHVSLDDPIPSAHELNRSASGASDPKYPHARRIYYRVTLLRMEAVDTVNQTWTAELYFEFVFAVNKQGPPNLPEAQRAALAAEVQAIVDEGGRPSVAVGDKIAKLFWPKISSTKEEVADEVWVTTSVNVSMRRAIARAEKIAEAGHHFLSFSMRTVRTFSQSFPLELFPIDQQLLMARIVLNQGRASFRFALTGENASIWGAGESSTTDGDQASINAVNGAFSPMMGEWRLRKKTCARSCVSDAKASRSGTQYPVLKVMILIKRRYGYHAWLLGLPLFAIAVLALVVLWSDMSGSDRFAATSALLFAAIQIKAQVAALLPRLHNPTMLDQFTIFVIIFVLLTSLQSFVTNTTCSESPLPCYTVLAIGLIALLPIVWPVYKGLVLKQGRFEHATKNIFHRPKLGEEEGYYRTSVCHTVTHSGINFVRHCCHGKKPITRTRHSNVPENQDCDELIDDWWPTKKDFRVA